MYVESELDHHIIMNHHGELAYPPEIEFGKIKDVDSCFHFLAERK